ncbi:MAG: nicotinate-nucleotide--dimethylbenzimidazole phosphoribosyltransferase [Paracoccaceae bacterium]|jgi:nicotinate-nucleotide--dimethylbenzimidazole phosphoribosyltransferase
MDQVFSSFEAFSKALQGATGPDAAAHDGALRRNAQLIKPLASLGRLENLAIWYGAWRGSAEPLITNPLIIVFAGNHGVTAQSVSAFPSQVTAQMVANFHSGGAAINQLAKTFGARLAVHALELERTTQDFTKAPAMTEAETLTALKAGWDAVDPACDLLVVGEMGIGNTTAAAAIAFALFGGVAQDWTGRGTGVDDRGLALKTKVVADAVALHITDSPSPLQILARLGGRELAAMAGALTFARLHHIPVILDGFICTASAAVLQQINADALANAVAGHVSSEGAHRRLLGFLDKAPLLDLGLRLGEASGGALAIGILQAAVNCHSGMATFEDSGVSAAI